MARFSWISVVALVGAQACQTNRCCAQEPAPPVEAAPDERGDAARDFSEPTTENERTYLRAYYKARVVADRIRRDLTVPHQAFGGAFTENSGGRMEGATIDLFVLNGEYAAIGHRGRDIGTYVVEAGLLQLKSSIPPQARVSPF